MKNKFKINKIKYISIISVLIAVLLFSTTAFASYPSTTPSWNGDTNDLSQYNNYYYYIPENITDQIYLNVTTLDVSYIFYNVDLYNNITMQIYDSYSNLYLFNFTANPSANTSNNIIVNNYANSIGIYCNADFTSVIFNSTYYNTSYTATSINITGSGQFLYQSLTLNFYNSNSNPASDLATTIFVLSFVFIIIGIVVALYQRSKGEE